ncbi:hypothetical protein Tco_1243877 [Tanacetum coccineum]
MSLSSATSDESSMNLDILSLWGIVAISDLVGITDVSHRGSSFIIRQKIACFGQDSEDHADSKLFAGDFRGNKLSHPRKPSVGASSSQLAIVRLSDIVIWEDYQFISRLVDFTEVSRIVCRRRLRMLRTSAQMAQNRNTKENLH